MNRKKSLVGIGLIAALMALTGWLLFRDQPVTRLLHTLGQLRPGWLLLGLALMLAFVGCEATCSHLILGRLGHRAPLRRCLGYSFVGFYVSSITPSATGGQPAQIYYMSRDGVPAAHGALNMMLIAVCYQVVVIGYALAVALLITSRKQRRRQREKLAQLELGLEDRMDHPVGLLSGGQRQALTLLMATLVTPKLLLLDEHTAALDPATAEKVLALTKKIVGENHITCLMITHNIPSALSLGNRTIMMNNGRIVLELAGAERENMTTEQLLKVFHEQGVSNDRILFSAES